MEKEVNKCLNFLDVKVHRKRDFTLEFSTYHKPTFTGVFLHWNSPSSRKYKIGLIRCLLDRSNEISSSEKDKTVEMEQIRDLLLKNGYPKNIIITEFDKFIKISQNQQQKIVNPEEKIKHLSLPYLNVNLKSI